MNITKTKVASLLLPFTFTILTGILLIQEITANHLSTIMCLAAILIITLYIGYKIMHTGSVTTNLMLILFGVYSILSFITVISLHDYIVDFSSITMTFAIIACATLPCMPLLIQKSDKNE